MVVLVVIVVMVQVLVLCTVAVDVAVKKASAFALPGECSVSFDQMDVMSVISLGCAL